MCDVYGEACFTQKNAYKWAKLYKKGWNSIQDETGRPTIVTSPEMVDSVNAFILADRRVTIEDISEQLGIFVGTAYKIVHDNVAFFPVSCHWVAKMLISEHKALYCS